MAWASDICMGFYSSRQLPVSLEQKSNRWTHLEKSDVKSHGASFHHTHQFINPKWQVPVALVVLGLPWKKQDSQFGSPQNFITVDGGGFQSLWVWGNWRQSPMHWCFLGRSRWSSRVWDAAKSVTWGCTDPSPEQFVILLIPGEWKSS